MHYTDTLFNFCASIICLLSLLESVAKWYNFAFLYRFPVRSGLVYLPNTAGTLRYAGLSGYGWSSRGSSTHANGSAVPSSYNLAFGASVAYSSNGPDGRNLAFPLRCLSTVLGMWESG